MSLKKYLHKIYDKNSNIDCELIAYALDYYALILYMTHYIKNKHVLKVSNFFLLTMLSIPVSSDFGLHHARPFISNNIILKN